MIDGITLSIGRRILVVFRDALGIGGLDARVVNLCVHLLVECRLTVVVAPAAHVVPAHAFEGQLPAALVLQGSQAVGRQCRKSRTLANLIDTIYSTRQLALHQQHVSKADNVERVDIAHLEVAVVVIHHGFEVC